MAMGDLPQFAAGSYTTTSHALSNLGVGNQFIDIVGTGSVSPSAFTITSNETWPSEADIRRIQAAAQAPARPIRSGIKEPKEKPQMANPSRRLVKIIIVDPNENIPLDKCVLFSGEEKLTDLNDQELFFELDIKTMLTKHNEERVKIADKKVKERTEYLEPAKIRDLKMVVVTIAEF